KALAASLNAAIVATEIADQYLSRVWRVDTGNCRITAAQDLASSDVDLQIDPGGNWLTITHRGASQVCTVPATLGGSGPITVSTSPAAVRSSASRCAESACPRPASCSCSPSVTDAPRSRRA